MERLFVFMICCHTPLRANPFLKDLCGLSLFPASIYLYTLEKIKQCATQLISLNYYIFHYHCRQSMIFLIGQLLHLLAFVLNILWLKVNDIPNDISLLG